MLRVLFHRVLTAKTPIGRKMRAKMLTQGGPLIRVKPQDLAAAGVERVPRVAGVQDGQPVLEDGRVLDVANVDLVHRLRSRASRGSTCPSSANTASRVHEGGVVTGEPGLYFVGRLFLYAVSSMMVHGVGRDAARVVQTIVARAAAPGTGAMPRSLPTATALPAA